MSQLPVGGAPGKPGMRRWWIVGGVVVLLLVGAGVAWWLWPSGSGPGAVPGTVQASLVSVDEASRVLDQTLQSQHSISEPPPALPSTPATCAVAVGPATQAVYSPGWTTFDSVTYQDSAANADHTVTQVIGRYSTAAQASQVFGTLSAGVASCRSAVRADGDGDQRASQWSYAVEADTAAAVSWTATQQAGGGWACYRQARLKARAVLEVAVCEAGDGSQAAATIADQFASRVSG